MIAISKRTGYHHRVMKHRSAERRLLPLLDISSASPKIRHKIWVRIALWTAIIGMVGLCVAFIWWTLPDILTIDLSDTDTHDDSDPQKIISISGLTWLVVGSVAAPALLRRKCKAGVVTPRRQAFKEASNIASGAALGVALFLLALDTFVNWWERKGAVAAIALAMVLTVWVILAPKIHSPPKSTTQDGE